MSSDSTPPPPTPSPRDEATAPGDCPACGTPIPADAPSGLCPRCLAEGASPSQGPTLAAGSAGAVDFDPPSPEALDALLPDFEILELVGQGGMGAVYKARQVRLDRIVAVKILPAEVAGDPAFTERFAREARALARLSHPNIVSVFDFGTADGFCYLVMEFIDGANLRQVLSGGHLSPREALAIVSQLCDALQTAHDAGFVHRDIKPENILLTEKGVVKVADFGLVKMVGQNAFPVTLTGTHQALGTLRYMAPEQLEGSAEADHRADLYSLGVVFYELLTGRIPAGRFDPPSKKVTLDVRLDQIVLHALEGEPDRRYQHASEIKTDVESVNASEASPPTVARAADSSATHSKISKKAVVGASLVPLAAVLVIPVLLTLTFYARARMPEESAPIPLGFIEIALGVVFTLAGLAAPFATTLLGAIAIGDIRRSAGRLHGLSLAVFDALAFPLLAFNLLSWVLIWRTLQLINPSQLHDVSAALLALAWSAVIDYLVVRWVWRRAKRPIGT